MTSRGDPPAPSEVSPRSPHPAPVAVAGLVALLIAAVVVTWVIVSNDGHKSASVEPTAVMQAFGDSLRNGDLSGALSRGPISGSDRGLVEWHIALMAEPTFSGCEELAELNSGTSVRCRIEYGERFFFSRVLDRKLTSAITGIVAPDGTLRLDSWPEPAGLERVEREMRLWIQESHPELESRMFGRVHGVLRFTREAGELHMEYLDEYLAYLETGDPAR